MTQVINAYLAWPFPRVDVEVIESRGDPGDHVAAARGFVRAMRKVRSISRSGEPGHHRGAPQRARILRPRGLDRALRRPPRSARDRPHARQRIRRVRARATPSWWARSCAATSRVISLSEETSEICARHVGADNVELVPNAIPGGDPHDKQKVVVFGGVVSHRKGIDILQEAWRQAAPPEPWRLVVAGPIRDAHLVDRTAPAGRVRRQPRSRRADGRARHRRGRGAPLPRRGHAHVHPRGDGPPRLRHLDVRRRHPRRAVGRTAASWCARGRSTNSSRHCARPRRTTPRAAPSPTPASPASPRSSRQRPSTRASSPSGSAPRRVAHARAPAEDQSASADRRAPPADAHPSTPSIRRLRAISLTNSSNTRRVRREFELVARRKEQYASVSHRLWVPRCRPRRRHGLDRPRSRRNRRRRAQDRHPLQGRGAVLRARAAGDPHRGHRVGPPALHDRHGRGRRREGALRRRRHAAAEGRLRGGPHLRERRGRRPAPLPRRGRHRRRQVDGAGRHRRRARSARARRPARPWCGTRSSCARAGPCRTRSTRIASSPGVPAGERGRDARPTSCARSTTPRSPRTRPSSSPTTRPRSS